MSRKRVITLKEITPTPQAVEFICQACGCNRYEHLSHMTTVEHDGESIERHRVRCDECRQVGILTRTHN